jgi:hypothetical protein
MKTGFFLINHGTRTGQEDRVFGCSLWWQTYLQTKYSISVTHPDPGSGAFKTGPGMNNPDHISESLETIFLG